MLDIHAHLYWESYDADRDEMIRRAFDAGIEKMICVGTEPEDNPRAIEVAERYEGVYASVGIHPSFLDEIEKEVDSISNIVYRDGSGIRHTAYDIRPEIMERILVQVDNLKRVAQSSDKVIAIGECGLDYYVRNEQSTVNSEQGTENSEQGVKETADAPLKSGTTVVSEKQKAIQKEGFLAQMEVARELGVPLIIHTRPSAGTMDAYEDLFQILTHNLQQTTNNSPTPQSRGLDSSPRAEEQEPQANESAKNHLSLISHPLSFAILHCYQGDTEITKKFLELPNVYFSFAGSITYSVKKALVGTKDDPSEVVKLVPLSRLFVETDAPFLAPVPHRGERNEPAYAIATAEKVCELKGCSREELDQALRTSFEHVFDK